MRILSIETSCDETAAAVTEWNGAEAHIIAHTVSSQASLHSKWGGVVPNLASREHIRNIVPVIEETLERAKLSPADIDLIAVTQGPGLMPALLVGVSAGKTLSFVWKKPLIGINHLEGHIYANFVRNDQLPMTHDQKISNDQISNSNIKSLEIDSKFINPCPSGRRENSTFPLIALIVSGGHTQLMLMRDHFQYELLGETLDDAAGECFDKVARLLGLPYPGGPVVAKRADEFRRCYSKQSEESRNIEDIDAKNEIRFPRPMLSSGDYNFSFSGLKTAVLYFLKKHEGKKNDKSFIDAICHEFQESVVDVLVEKSRKAIFTYQPKTFIIAGGVSANVRLRERLQMLIEKEFPATHFSTPEFTYSLDNAAMIGVAAAYRYGQMNDKERKRLTDIWKILEPDANLPFQPL